MLISGLVSIMVCAAFYLIYYYLDETSIVYQDVYEQDDDIIGDLEEEDRDGIMMSNSVSEGRESLTSSLRKGQIDSMSSLAQSPMESSINLPLIPPAIFSITSWGTLGPIVLYMTIAFINSTYLTTLPLFYSSSYKQGGLGLDARSVALSFSLLAGSKLLFQFFLFDKILLAIGTSKRTFSVGMLLYIPSHIAIPFLAILGSVGQFLLISIIMISFGTGESLAYLAVILMITESQVPANLGKAHGLASTSAALCRTIAPSIAGALWEWSVTLKWNWLVFVVGALMSIFGLIASG